MRTILLLRASYLSRIYEKFDSFEEALSMVCRIYEEHLFLPFQTMSFSPARFAYKFEDLVWFIRDFEEFGLLVKKFILYYEVNRSIETDKRSLRPL